MERGGPSYKTGLMVVKVLLVTGLLAGVIFFICWSLGWRAGSQIAMAMAITGTVMILLGAGSRFASVETRKPQDLTWEKPVGRWEWLPYVSVGVLLVIIGLVVKAVLGV